MEDQPESTRKLLDQMNTDGRVLLEARMLPDDRPLTRDEMHHVREHVMGYIKRHQIPRAHLAREIDTSNSTVSMVLRGTYAGKAEAVIRKLNQWIERHARRHRASANIDYVHTRIAEDMQTVAHLAFDECAIGVIVAPSGCGKTMVLQVLTEQMQGRYHYCTQDDSPREFMRNLALVNGEPNIQCNTAELVRKVVQRLKGTNRTQFLDEAHQLPREVFSRIRAINDLAGVAFVLAGTHEILDKVDDQANSAGQLQSRCIPYNAMDHVYNAERPHDGSKLGRPQFSRDEIRAVFATSKVRFDDDAFSMVWALACLPGRGSLRLAIRTVNRIRHRFGVKVIKRSHLIDMLMLTCGLEGSHMISAAQQHLYVMDKRSKQKQLSNTG